MKTNKVVKSIKAIKVPMKGKNIFKSKSLRIKINSRAIPKGVDVSIPLGAS